MRRSASSICLSAAVTLLVAAVAPAWANGSGSSAGGGSSKFTAGGNSLRSSSGGTGLSKGGGTGGTGIPTTANTPVGKFRPTFKPAEATAPPPAGVRPHTDLAAAEKRTSLSSAALFKRSSLYRAGPSAPGDPPLAPPVLNKIGATIESARSFQTLPGIAGTLSKGEVYPTNGGRRGVERPHASLSSGGTGGAAALSASVDEEDIAPLRRGELLGWLANVLACLGTAVLGYWLWAAAPKGPRMRGPATVGSIGTLGPVAG